MKKPKRKQRAAPKAKKPANPKVSTAPNWRAIVLTTDEAGAAVKIGGERIRQLTKAGWIRKSGQNSYLLGNVIDGFLAYRDDLSAKAAADTEQSRLAKSRRAEIELRIAREKGQLTETAEAVAFVDEALGTLKSEFDGMPARVTRDLEFRNKIEAEIDDAFRRAAERAKQAADVLASGSGAVDADAEDDA